MNRQRGIAGDLVLLAIYGACAAAAIGAVWFAWTHLVRDPYLEQGRVEQREKDAPVIAELTKSRDEFAKAYDTLAASTREQNESLRLLAEQSKAALRAAAAAKKEAEARAARYANEITQLRTIAVGPPAANVQEACREADRVLTELAVIRLRGDDSAATGSGSDGASGGAHSMPSVERDPDGS